MALLIVGLIIFFAIHLVPSVPGLRDKLVSSLGKTKYLAMYALTALAGMVLFIYGFSQAEFQAIYQPPAWGRYAVIMVMVVSFILFAAADMKSNVKRFIRHPMLLGVVLWAGVHLLANGDLASLLLFGSFLVFSIVAMISANRRGASLQQEKYPLKKDIIVVIGGVGVYLIFMKYLHPWLIGVAVI